jgi:hypothetical protein
MVARQDDAPETLVAAGCVPEAVEWLVPVLVPGSVTVSTRVVTTVLVNVAMPPS